MGETVAAVQMTATTQVADNLAEIRRHVAAAADAGAVLVVLPENCSIMAANSGDMLVAAERPGDGPAQDCLAECAARHRLWLIAGSVPLQCDDPGRARSACLVYNPQGRAVCRYDKIHLFDVDISEDEGYRESNYFEPGEAFAVVDTDIGRIGLSICYDIRFPEMYRALLDRGAQMFVVPAAFSTTTGRVHWEVLLRARAVENQAFVIAPAQHGHHANGRDTYGHTMIIDPWGEILAQRESGCGVATAVIDTQLQQRLGHSFPVLQHRRPLVGSHG